MKTYAGIGSTRTLDAICARMTRIAAWMHDRDYWLRSGGADKADLAFEAGASDKKEIFLPWKGFNGSKSPLFHVSKEAFDLAARFHPNWGAVKKQGSQKLLARDGYQVLGKTLDDPVEFVVCWTSDGEASGGTGQAMRIAAYYEIPTFNLHDETAAKRLHDFVISREI